jgi:hypothetical protein
LDVHLDDTLPPNIPKPQTNVRAMPREMESNPLYQHSLTPVNVLKKIHLDIVRVLGIQPTVGGKFTKLEQELIYNIEKIIRKGRCPSILVKNKELMSVLNCLQKYFDEQAVVIEMDNGEGREVPSKIPVFKSLFDIAVDAARSENRIRELRTEQSATFDPKRKDAIKQEIEALRNKKDRYVVYYQKIIFTNAAELLSEKTRRTISLFGKPCTLDELLSFFKRGGQFSQAMTVPFEDPSAAFDFEIDSTGRTIEETPLDLEGPESDVTDLSFSSNFSERDDVVDWSKIKKDNKEPQEKPLVDHYEFNI